MDIYTLVALWIVTGCLGLYMLKAGWTVVRGSQSLLAIGLLFFTAIFIVQIGFGLAGFYGV